MGKKQCFFFKKSARVLRHLKSRLSNTEPTKWNMNIVVREWNNIEPQFEFRGLVYGNNLNAITHYYKFLYVEEIAQNKDNIENKLKDYFVNTVRDKLMHIENYVIDFILIGDDVKIIELNPFTEASSCGLFKWETDRDIFEGKQDFEFRILEKPIPNVLDELSPRLRIMLQSIRPDDDEVVEVENKKTGWFSKIKKFF